MRMPYWICPKCKVKHHEPSKHNCAEAVEAERRRVAHEEWMRSRRPPMPMGDWRAH